MRDGNIVKGEIMMELMIMSRQMKRIANKMDSVPWQSSANQDWHYHDAIYSQKRMSQTLRDAANITAGWAAGIRDEGLSA